MHARLAVSLCVIFVSNCSLAQREEDASEGDSVQEPSPSQRIRGRSYAEGRDDPSFMFCTIQYSNNGWDEPLGFGWPTDYPNSGFNLMKAISERTSIEIARDEDGEPEQTVLSDKDAGLKDFPFIFMSDVGTVGFSKEEIAGLRDYLLEGGFLHADDFWGERAWANWEYEIGQVLPPDEYPIMDIPLELDILHLPFEVGEVPQIPSVQYWNGTAGASGTSERGEETKVPHLRGIWDKQGRLMVVMSHNTDLADSWEAEAEVGSDYYNRFSEGGGIALGINIVTYALGH